MSTNLGSFPFLFTFENNIEEIEPMKIYLIM